MDTIRIKTTVGGHRSGTLICSEFEGMTHSDYKSFDSYGIDKILYDATEVELFEIDTIEDGDYPLSLFKQVYLAAPFVADGQPTPTVTNKQLYSYVGDDAEEL